VAYATTGQVMAVLATTAASSVTDDRIDAAIVDVEAEIDARLSLRYVTPITVLPTPAVLVKITVDFAVYRVMLEHRGTKDLEERDPAQLRLNESKQLLDDIVNGLADLPGDIPAAEGGAGDPNNWIEDNVFTLDDFRLGFDYRYGDRGPYELGVRWWEHGR
jgi:phage gp36-like protein